MTNEEALKCLDNIFNYCEEIDIHIPEEERSGYQMLPDVLKLMNYLRRAKESFEKQIAKRPLDADITNEHGYGKCPSCCMHVDVFEHNPYCDCGQKILWE